MKILIFAETYYPDVMGGGEFSTKQMAEGLAEKGHEAVVYCLGEDDHEDEIRGVRIVRRYIKGWSGHFLSLCKNRDMTDPFGWFSKTVRKWGDLYPDRKWYAEYLSIMLKERPDAVHTASPMSYLGRFNLWKAAYDLKIPVSHVVRSPALLSLGFLKGALDGYNRYRNAKASAYLTALAAPTHYLLDAHISAGIKGRRFNEVIYNAAGIAEMSAVSEEAVRSKENMILYAGEISEKKGIGLLTEAAAMIPGIKLILIGKGDMEGYAAGHGAELMGWMDRDKLFAVMKRAKAVILPSSWEEPFGRILIEAIYNGTIAIGSDRGGIPEVLGHDSDHIFKSGDKEGLKSCIERVAGLSPARYAKELKAQQQMAAAFSDEIYRDKWESFFIKQKGQSFFLCDARPSTYAP